MVAGQDAQAAGKQRQGFVNTELHRKIGNARPGRVGVCIHIGRGQHPRLELLAHAVQVG